jgi:hypothetical protein
MAEYWQDKRINHKHVACAWALVLVVVAIMLAITSLAAPDCPQWRDVDAGACSDGKGVSRALHLRPSPRAVKGS